MSDRPSNALPLLDSPMLTDKAVEAARQARLAAPGANPTEDMRQALAAFLVAQDRDALTDYLVIYGYGYIPSHKARLEMRAVVDALLEVEGTDPA